MAGRRTRARLLDTFLHKELNRRRMLGTSLKVGIGGLLAAHLGPLACDEGGDPGGDGDGGDLPLIGIAAGGDAVDGMGRALALVGGLGFVESGQSVFIKLASNYDDPYPYSTNPDVLVWLVRQLQDAGAGSIVCGDSPYFGTDDPVFEGNGLQAAADEVGIELRDFRLEDDWVTIPTDEAPHWPTGMRIPAVMAEADHIITLPNLKTHVLTGVTLSLKVEIGATHRDDRETSLGDHGQVAVQIAEINAHVTPSLNLLDGHEACINGGPNPPFAPGTESGHVGLSMASADRVALDVAGAAVLRMHTSEEGLLALESPWHVETIREAVALGLGIAGPEAFDAGFDGVDPSVRDALLADVGA